MNVNFTEDVFTSNTRSLNLNDRLKCVKDFIDSSYSDKITLEQLSKIVLLNPRYFLKVFKIYYDITPHQYLTKRRLEEAKLMLGKKFKVTEVCKKVGFEDLASFSKLFKRHIGFSPLVFSDR